MSMSQVIREYLADHPDHTASTVVAALKVRGIDVTHQAAHNARYALRLNSGKRPAATKTVVMDEQRWSAGVRNGEFVPAQSIPAEHVVATHELSKSLGGLGRLREAVRVLEELRA